MLQFEIKKVFTKFKNKMALLFLLATLIAVSMLTINRVEYIDENGGRSVGISAARSLRAEKNKWAGYLTKNVLQQAAEEHAAIVNSEGASSNDTREQDLAYSRQQGISTIVEIINSAFSEWRDYNYYAIDGISIEDASNIYERRVSNLKKWLDSGEETFSKAQKDFLISQYESLKTPFYYEYTDGWSALLQNISTFILILALFIGFFVSGIFSDEFHLRADSIFFSSRLGRNRAILSKMGAGFSIVTAFYAVFILLHTAIVLLVLGADGANCPIQLDLWRSVYNITFFQAYLLIITGGYVGTLFAAILSMLVSAATRSTATATIVPFIILCAFPFLSRILTLPQICAFFPDQLLEIYISVKEFNLVQFGGKVMNVVTVITPAYLAACLLLLPVLYRIFKKAEVK